MIPTETEEREKGMETTGNGGKQSHFFVREELLPQGGFYLVAISHWPHNYSIKNTVAH